MENIEPLQILLLMAAVAIAAFQFGRITVRGREAGAKPPVLERHEAEQLVSSLPASKQEDVDRLLRDGKLIEAVKIVRAETGAGLRDAKRAIDHRRKSLG